MKYQKIKLPIRKNGFHILNSNIKERGYYGILVNWQNDGEELKKDSATTLRNKNYFFKEGITYSASGSKGLSFRILPNNHIFDAGGSAIFAVKNDSNLHYFLALLNSKVCMYISKCFNPTVNTQVGDLKRIPFVQPDETTENIISEYSKINIKIRKFLSNYYIIEMGNSNSPLLLMPTQSITDLRNRLNIYLDYENHLTSQVLLNEGIINKKIFEVYELSPTDKSTVIAKEGESIGNLPVHTEAKNAYLAEEVSTKEFPLDNIKDFIRNLPEKEFSPGERKKITEGFPTLYQKNNDLEEFCIRHQVNPINVWYWFKESNVVPKQRMNTIAMEFLADLIREILMEDEDGITPLVRSSGEEILIDRIEKKFMEKGFNSAQFAQFDKVLGRELNDYLNNHFFKALSDHLNLFMYLPKTPFIWHITSGANHGFDAYIIIYKWSRDRLFLLKSIYIEKRETALKNRQSDLQNDDSAKAQNEKDLIFKQLKEIANLKTKIDELLAEGYDPILDDGVGKNIAPLQNKGIIAYDVLNKGQLEKYLNADW